MPAVKTILVPVDLGELAASAYRFSLRLAEDLSASIHLLYCLSPPPGVTTRPDEVWGIAKELERSAKANLHRFREEGLARAGRHQPPVVSIAVRIGGFRQCIRQESENRKADLVLIGTHGVKDNWNRLFGSNAASLVGKVETPLLIVPAGAVYRPFKSVCFATDFRDRDLSCATRLNKALYPFLPHIHFLHVQDPLGEEPAEGIGFFRRAFERPQQGMEATFTTIKKADVTDGIFDYLERYHHDLLVMIKPGRGWWRRLVFHSETEETAGITNLPLLIMGESAWTDAGAAL